MRKWIWKHFFRRKKSREMPRNTLKNFENLARVFSPNCETVLLKVRRQSKKWKINFNQKFLLDTSSAVMTFGWVFLPPYPKLFTQKPRVFEWMFLLNSCFPLNIPVGNQKTVSKTLRGVFCNNQKKFAQSFYALCQINLEFIIFLEKFFRTCTAQLWHSGRLFLFNFEK